MPALRGCVVLAIITALAYKFELNSAATGFVFLMAIVLNCLDSGIRSAMVVCIVAVGLLNYFFIEPVLTFRVAHPVDIAALAAFLTAALVTTRLASRAREQAQAARRDRRNLQLLYDCAQRLLILDPLHTETPKLLDAVLAAFHPKAVSYFDADSATPFSAGSSQRELARKTRDAYIMGTDWDDPPSGIALRRIRVKGEIAGAVGFEGLENSSAVAGPAAALVAMVLERSQALQTAVRAEDAARTEMLRTAILDALAHEFKTPLATILTAAGGMRAAGPLAPQQAELAEMIEEEAERMGQLSSRLLRLARIESGEMRLQREPFDVDAQVQDLVDRYASGLQARRVSLINQGAPEELSADVELFQLALSQLLDNACRYSPAASTVEVTMGRDRQFLWIVVSNRGTPIRPSERSLIFERFFRGKDGRKLAGTGLGLYVARKIALAHGGTLDLAPPEFNNQDVAFRLAFPLEGEQCNAAA